MKEAEPLLHDEETEKKFKERWQHKLVVIGKIFLLEEIKAKGLKIKDDLMFQGWTKFLEIKEPIYSKLVRGVYVVSLKNQDLIIQSNIKGRDVFLMEHHIRIALDMNDKDGATYQ